MTFYQGEIKCCGGNLTGDKYIILYFDNRDQIVDSKYANLYVSDFALNFSV